MLEVQTEGLLAEAGRERVKRDAVRHRKEQYEHVRHPRGTALCGGSWQEWGRPQPWRGSCGRGLGAAAAGSAASVMGSVGVG
jgi:hypothetical protein